MSCKYGSRRSVKHDSFNIPLKFTFEKKMLLEIALPDYCFRRLPGVQSVMSVMNFEIIQCKSVRCNSDFKTFNVL
jgi:hypothetical protein